MASTPPPRNRLAYAASMERESKSTRLRAPDVRQISLIHSSSAAEVLRSRPCPGCAQRMSVPVEPFICRQHSTGIRPRER